LCAAIVDRLTVGGDIIQTCPPQPSDARVHASYHEHYKAEAIKAEERRRATKEYQRQWCKKCAGTGVGLVGWEFVKPVRCRRCGGSGKRFFW
jgi:hypothetical protein